MTIKLYTIGVEKSSLEREFGDFFEHLPPKDNKVERRSLPEMSQRGISGTSKRLSG